MITIDGRLDFDPDSDHHCDLDTDDPHDLDLDLKRLPDLHHTDQLDLDR